MQVTAKRLLTAFIVMLLMFGSFLIGSEFAPNKGSGTCALCQGTSETAMTPTADTGAVSAPVQADYWTCPMHPEIKSPNPGHCPICKMVLVPVTVPKQEPPATPAMPPAMDMAPKAEPVTPPATKEEPAAKESAPLSFDDVYKQIITTYLDLVSNMAKDNAKESCAAASKLLEICDSVNQDKRREAQDAAGFNMSWMRLSKHLSPIGEIADAAKSGELKPLREKLPGLSAAVIEALNFYESGNPMDVPLYVLHCPMTNNGKGADWLQLDKEVRNPYYGAEMLECGEVTKTIPPAK